MGGRAFIKQGLTVDSMTTTEYYSLRAYIGGKTANDIKSLAWLRVPHHVEEKDSHGDMDILFIPMSENTTQEILDRLTAALTPYAVNHNGPVTSFALVFPGTGNRLVQVDFVHAQQAWGEFAFQYHSWNDAGNLLGRIAHRLGFKLGHDGLHYVIREGSHVVEQICITRDWWEAIGFLGFDNIKYGDFKTFDQLFSYVENNIWFNKEIYLLENRNHVSRTRDAKRKTYNAFLEWVERRDGFQYPWDKGEKARVREIMLTHAFEVFPGFQDAYRKACDAALNKRLTARWVNGEIVGQLTGASGRALGEIMTMLREVIPDQRLFEAFVQHHSEDAARILIDKAGIPRVVQDAY